MWSTILKGLVEILLLLQNLSYLKRHATGFQHVTILINYLNCNRRMAD